MPKSRVNCPNCRQPVLAEIEQLFDVNSDPTAKQKFLSGTFNVIQCPSCGYQGSLATPIVYHDPDKELLLTFAPAELGLPRNEQERIFGSLINQAMAHLPQEKRKGYLLNPQAVLTLQGLVERVLEADGITREMIEAQQKKLSLVRRLLAITDEADLAEVAKQEDALIDSEFFALTSRLAEAAVMGGDEASARKLAELQQKLLPHTTFGRQVQAQSQEVEAAVADLQSLGEKLDRESLLELVINAPNDTRLSALTSLARPVMDYQFFQILSERLEKSKGEDSTRLNDLRAKLLDMTQEIDRQMEARAAQTRQLIDEILKAQDIREATHQSLQAVDNFFLQEVDRMLKKARGQGDLALSSKLQQILAAIEEANTPPPELELIEEFLDAVDDAGRSQFLKEHAEAITPEFLELMANITAQVQASEDKEFADRVVAANRQALRFSMEKSMRS